MRGACAGDAHAVTVIGRIAGRGLADQLNDAAMWSCMALMGGHHLRRTIEDGIVQMDE